MDSNLESSGPKVSTPIVPVPNRPNKKNIDAFGAIVNFVNDLMDVFAKNTPLALYHRLVSKINLSDTEGIQKAIAGFAEFLKDNETYLVSNQLDQITRGATIRYGTSDKIVLEVQKFIHQSDENTKETIRQHLLTISTILEPNKEKIAQLEQRFNALNINTGTKEGQFINNIMEKAKTSMTNVSTQDPMQAMMSIFQSGIIQEMVVGLQEGVGSGQMNMQTLLGTMQSAIGSIMPPQTPQVEEVKERKDGPD